MPGKPFADAVIAAALALVATACRSPSAERAPDARYETIRPEWRGDEARISREWLRVSAGWLERDQRDDDPVGDGPTFGIEGGFDLATRAVLTPSVELGVNFTDARVTLPDTDNVDLWRALVGLRGTYVASGWRPYARAGGFVRWSTQDQEEPLDPYGTGVYAGIGADWPYLDGMWLGPSFTWFHALNEDAPGGETDEFLFSLSATFRL